MPGKKSTGPAGAQRAAAERARDEAPAEQARDEADLREQVREMAARALRGQRVDPASVEEVVRSLSPRPGPDPRPPDAEARRALLDGLAGMGEELARTAGAAQAALDRLASKGTDFTENDLKDVFAALRDLHQTYARTAGRVADAASGNIERELRGLAGHAQQVGTDAGARLAATITDVANRLGAATRDGASQGLNAAFDYGGRMSMLASGVLAGIADALREQSARDDTE